MVDCRPETLAFTATAPLRTSVSRELGAAPDRVFDALADAPSWPSWFPSLTAARWLSPPPHGVGATREVTLGRGLRVTERFVRWEPGRRFAFTFVSANLPVVRAGLELVELVPVGADRTRLTYTFAIEPTGVPRRLAGTSAPLVRRTIGRALATLDRSLTA